MSWKIVLLSLLFISTSAWAGRMKELYTETGEAVEMYFLNSSQKVVQISDYQLLTISDEGSSQSDIGVTTKVEVESAPTNTFYRCLTYFEKQPDGHFEDVGTDCHPATQEKFKLEQ
jgi:hypothetical protein